MHINIQKYFSPYKNIWLMSNKYYNFNLNEFHECTSYIKYICTCMYIYIVIYTH